MSLVDRLKKYLKKVEVEITPNVLENLEVRCKSVFELMEKIDAGANAEIARACVNKDCQYVMKITDSADGDTEYEMLKTLHENKFPHIPTVYDAFECDQLVVLVLEKLSGSLLDYVERGGKIKPAIKQLKNITSKLNELGISHGDLHPGNFMYRGTVENPEFVIIDFGSAEVAEDELESNFIGDDFVAPLVDALNKSQKWPRKVFRGSFMTASDPFPEIAKIYPYWLFTHFQKKYKNDPIWRS